MNDHLNGKTVIAKHKGFVPFTAFEIVVLSWLFVLSLVGLLFYFGNCIFL